MGWRSDREDYLAEFERRSFGVVTHEEAWAMAVLCGEWPRDYDDETEAEWAEVQRRAKPVARAALARIAPVLDEMHGTCRDLLEERAALMRRAANIDDVLAVSLDGPGVATLIDTERGPGT